MSFSRRSLSRRSLSLLRLLAVGIAVGSAAVSAVLSAVPAFAQQIVAPNSLAAVDGNSDNRFPFLVTGGIRSQQVYNASQFSTLGGPRQITQIAFRPDATAGAAFARTLSNVTIRLSTIAAAADGLSSTFASNVGADVVTALTGPLTLSSAFTGGTPKDFDVVINLTTPFPYNPANGNLLLDVLNNSPENNNINLFFDAEATTGDSVSRIISSEGAPTATTGTANSLGLATRFTFTLVSSAAPEPGSLALLALAGMPVLGAVARRRRAS